MRIGRRAARLPRGFSYKKVDATVYVFNPDASKPTFVLSLGLAF
jgi:hypothetical protein